MIHTASFFEPQNFGDGRLVSIAMQTPYAFAQRYSDSDRELAEVEELKPDWYLVSSYRSRVINKEKYKRIYYELLYKRFTGYWDDIMSGSLGPEKILNLFSLEDGDTLLCWEKYGKFCHRILVAEILKNNGVDVERK